jgi:hypothetical protein
MDRVLFRLSLVAAATTLMALEINGWGWFLGFLLVDLLMDVQIK